MDDGSSRPDHDVPLTPTTLETAEPRAEPIEDLLRADGVDPTLIRWMLSLTPEQRLRWLDNVVRTLHEVQRGT